MKVTMVPNSEVENIWMQIEPFMVGAAEYTRGRCTADDIKDQILQYNHTLWVAFDEEAIKGAVVTVIQQYPKLTCLSMVYTGGIRVDTWKDPMLVLLRQWAKDKGCDVIESTGRPGWAKIFKDDGHNVAWHTYELPVEPTGIGA